MRTTFPWPTPRPQSSDWMTELGEALRPHPDSGIESEELATLGNNYSSFSDKTVTSPRPAAKHGRILCAKLQ